MGGRIYNSVVTIGDYSIYDVVADPNGSLDAAAASLAVNSLTSEVWQNVDGASTWYLLRGQVIVWRPSEPAPTNGLYASWSTVYAAIVASPVPVSVLVDTSIAPATIPAGAWDFSGVEVELMGSYETGVALTVEDGALLTGVSKISHLIVTSQGSAPVFTPEAGQNGMTLQTVTLQRLAGTVPVIDVPNGAGLRLTCVDCILDDYAVRANGTLILALQGSTTMTDSSVDGTTGTLIVVCGSDSSPRFDQVLFSGAIGATSFTDKTKNWYVDRSNVAGTNLLTLASNNVNFTQVGAGSLSLPPASAATGPFFLKNSGTGIVTVVPDGADTIDGVAGNIDIAVGSDVILISDGSSAWITGGGGGIQFQTIDLLPIVADRITDTGAGGGVFVAPPATLADSATVNAGTDTYNSGEWCEYIIILSEDSFGQANLEPGQNNIIPLFFKFDLDGATGGEGLAFACGMWPVTSVNPFTVAGGTNSPPFLIGYKIEATGVRPVTRRNNAYSQGSIDTSGSTRLLCGVSFGATDETSGGFANTVDANGIVNTREIGAAQTGMTFPQTGNVWGIIIRFWRQTAHVGGATFAGLTRLAVSVAFRSPA